MAIPVGTKYYFSFTHFFKCLTLHLSKDPLAPKYYVTKTIILNPVPQPPSITLSLRQNNKLKQIYIHFCIFWKIQNSKQS